MEKSNQWLSLIANMGVVIGLLILVYELKQNRDVTIFEAVQANRVQRIEYFMSLRDSDHYAPISVKIREGIALSPEEDVRWKAHLVTIWAITYTEWVQADLGLIGEYSNVELQVEVAIRTTHSMELWDSGTRDFYPEGFVKYVESRRK